MRVSSASSTPPPPAFAAAAWAVLLLAALRSDVALATVASSSNDDAGDAPFQNHLPPSCALLLASPTHDSPVFFLSAHIFLKKKIAILSSSNLSAFWLRFDEIILLQKILYE